MNTSIKNVLFGIGSTMVIMPSTTIGQIQLPSQQKSDAENIASDWQKVGDDLRCAMRQIDSEQAQFSSQT